MLLLWPVQLWEVSTCVQQMTSEKSLIVCPPLKWWGWVGEGGWVVECLPFGEAAQGACMLSSPITLQLQSWCRERRGQGLHIIIGTISVPFSLNMSISSLLCGANWPLSQSSVKIYCWSCNGIFPLGLMNPFFVFPTQNVGGKMNRNIGGHKQRSCCRGFCWIVIEWIQRVMWEFSEAAHLTSSLPSHEMSEDKRENIWICLWRSAEV